MASGWTNAGKYYTLGMAWRDEAMTGVGTYFMMSLADDAESPTADHDTIGTSPALSEIAAGTGYTSGGGTEGQITRSSATTGFDTWTNSGPTTDEAFVIIKDTNDITWTAAGGTIPNDSPTTVATWALFSDDHGTYASRNLYAWFDLGGGRTVSNGQSLILQDCTLKIT